MGCLLLAVVVVVVEVGLYGNVSVLKYKIQSNDCSKLIAAYPLRFHALND